MVKSRWGGGSRLKTLHQLWEDGSLLQKKGLASKGRGLTGRGRKESSSAWMGTTPVDEKERETVSRVFLKTGGICHLIKGKSSKGHRGRKKESYIRVFPESILSCCHTKKKKMGERHERKEDEGKNNMKGERLTRPPPRGRALATSRSRKTNVGRRPRERTAGIRWGSPNLSSRNYKQTQSDIVPPSP